eukprot:CAMPEP_0119040716 /NCGR_PEP_ID=MMETSP1177-20130426/10724_1 /TAXON_ID=2985 /ORGANISM="Ochromonas sp, Strain CCMP1899" /LENGTH=127 /DNA_ID=CAMNT_0007006029 /DNA_START=103 /DNA_END=486 /DNA_ORIENTATION=-
MTLAFRGNLLKRTSQTSCYAGPRDLFKEFTVEACTPAVKEEMGISRWGTWSTRDAPKYKVGIKSPLKVYDGNELSYIISGKMTITPDEGPSKGVAFPVKAGDFVFFPDGFSCYWFVEEVISKHYYIY